MLFGDATFEIEFFRVIQQAKQSRDKSKQYKLLNMTKKLNPSINNYLM